VVNAACLEFTACCLSGGEPKVSEGQPVSIIKTDDILRLQIAVVYTESVAMLNGIEKL
jgi:hypothetical protein